MLYYLICKYCSLRFLDKNGDKTSKLRLGKIKNSFCSRSCAAQYNNLQKAEEICKRCAKKRKEISRWCKILSGASAIVFNNGYCPKCYALRRIYNSNEELIRIHEITATLKKENANVLRRKKYRRFEKTSSRDN